jgi:hypothetical protein
MLVPNRVSGHSKNANRVRLASEAAGIVGNAGLYTTTEDLLPWEQHLHLQ